MELREHPFLRVVTVKEGKRWYWTHAPDTSYRRQRDSEKGLKCAFTLPPPPVSFRCILGIDTTLQTSGWTCWTSWNQVRLQPSTEYSLLIRELLLSFILSLSWSGSSREVVRGDWEASPYITHGWKEPSGSENEWMGLSVPLISIIIIIIPNRHDK